MNQVNYQKELEKILNTLQEKGEAAPDYRPPRLAHRHRGGRL